MATAVLNEVADAKIDPEGKFKYILIKVTYHLDIKSMKSVSLGTVSFGFLNALGLCCFFTSLGSLLL